MSPGTNEIFLSIIVFDVITLASIVSLQKYLLKLIRKIKFRKQFNSFQTKINKNTKNIKIFDLELTKLIIFIRLNLQTIIKS